MLKNIVLLFMIMLSFTSCKTTDKAIDSDIELPGPTDTPDDGNIVTVESTRRAILRATRVQAETFAPVPFNEANRLFNEAIITTDNPETQQQLLQEATTKANQAFDEAYLLYMQSQYDRLDALIEEMRSKNIHLYETEEYDTLVEAIEILKDNLDNPHDLSLNEQRINELYALAGELMDRVERESKEVNVLYDSVEKRYNEAKKNKAEPELLSQVMALLAVADDAREEFDLGMSKEYLLMAQAKLNSLNTTTNQAQTETLMITVRDELISASRQTLIDSEQNPIKPTEWNATITAEEFKNLNEHERFTLLNQAVGLWQQGAKYHLSEPKRADELFLQAREAINTYLRGTATQFYVVQLRPARRDSLWRISGFTDIYGNPFLWPHIWSANQKMIPNPDLIFPGQRLVIPPVIQ